MYEVVFALNIFVLEGTNNLQNLNHQCSNIHNYLVVNVFYLYLFHKPDTKIASYLTRMKQPFPKIDIWKLQQTVIDMRKDFNGVFFIPGQLPYTNIIVTPLNDE